MKILSLLTKEIYDIEIKHSGENKSTCPECSKDRKKKNQKVFSWNESKKAGYCSHCNASFVEYKPFKKEKEYVIPVNKNITALTDKSVKWFESRMISMETLNKCKIYSDNEFMPQHNQICEVICFPYYFQGNLINVKYRGANKAFKLVSGAELIFWNLDCVPNAKSVIITEGEIDAISIIHAGFENCISVPNGGGSKAMDYLDNYIDLFENKEIILATDNDIKGIELRTELIRRFGSERCKIVEFQDCKDANEVLTTYGGTRLFDLIHSAHDIQVSGIVNLNLHYDNIYNLLCNGMQPGAGIGIQEMDSACTWELGRLAIWTGIPGHGKSEALDWINIRLNLKHNWKIAYFSPENHPIEYHFSKLAAKIHGKSFTKINFPNEEFEAVFDFIGENVSFIDIAENEDVTIENILEKAKYLIKKKGIKILVIDPYNKLEHKMQKTDLSETNYISRFLDILLNFAKRNNILIHLVAHPRKMVENSKGIFPCPSLYDINGSANFFNKADYGITIYRNFDENVTEFHFKKVKFRHLGTGGMVLRKYNPFNSRYEDINTTYDQYSTESYLKETVIQFEDNEFNYNPSLDPAPF